MSELIGILLSADFLYSVFRVTTPLLFAGMGAVISDVAGVPNIALEGLMLIAAFTGMFFSYVTQNALIGLAAAILFAVGFAGVLAFFTLYYRTNIILGGIAINSLASGGTVFMLYLVAHDKGTSVSLPSMTLPQISLPLIDRIPILGSIISGHNILTYVSVLAVIFTCYLLKRTALGFHIRAVGENKDAACSVGIHVEKTQAVALLLSGVMCGLGGAFMSMGYVSWFSRDMLASRGWVALSAEAMGLRTPIGTAVTCLLFGVADAFSNAAATIGWPSDLVKTIPYVVTLIGLTVFSVRVARKKRV